MEQTITDQILLLLEMVALMQGFKHAQEVFRLQAKPVGIYIHTRGKRDVCGVVVCSYSNSLCISGL
jgi:hypothetical protein